MNQGKTIYCDGQGPESDNGFASPKLTASAYRWGWFDWFCLWYPPGWLILLNRHWQHYHADPDGWNWLEYGLFLIPGGFYLALLMRWLRLGCRAPRSENSQLNSDYQRAFRDEILSPILKHYFRAELQGQEHLPQTGPLLVAMNHAGMCFPWDLIGLGWLLAQARNWQVQPLAHVIFFDHPWLHWWVPPGWSQVLGGVRAEKASFEIAISKADAKTAILYAPEGWRGLVKGWGQRYQLTTFDPSFILLSDRSQVPILPAICLGNEAMHPWTINLKKLARWIGLPLFPLSPLMIAFVLFPSMGVWAMRSHLRYELQPIYRPWEDQNKEEEMAQDHSHARSQSYHKAQSLRSQLQDRINQRRNMG